MFKKIGKMLLLLIMVNSLNAQDWIMVAALDKDYKTFIKDAKSVNYKDMSDFDKQQFIVMLFDHKQATCKKVTYMMNNHISLSKKGYGNLFISDGLNKLKSLKCLHKINNDINVEYRNNNALNYALMFPKSNNLEIVKFLVENGIDINRKDQRGKSPIDVSKNNDNKAVYMYLLSKVNPQEFKKAKKEQNEADKLAKIEKEKQEIKAKQEAIEKEKQEAVVKAKKEATQLALAKSKGYNSISEYNIALAEVKKKAETEAKKHLFVTFNTLDKREFTEKQKKFYCLDASIDKDTKNLNKQQIIAYLGKVLKREHKNNEKINDNIEKHIYGVSPRNMYIYFTKAIPGTCDKVHLDVINFNSTIELFLGDYVNYGVDMDDLFKDNTGYKIFKRKSSNKKDAISRCEYSNLTLASLKDIEKVKGELTKYFYIKAFKGSRDYASISLKGYNQIKDNIKTIIVADENLKAIEYAPLSSYTKEIPFNLIKSSINKKSNYIICKKMSKEAQKTFDDKEEIKRQKEEILYKKRKEKEKKLHQKQLVEAQSKGYNSHKEYRMATHNFTGTYHCSMGIRIYLDSNGKAKTTGITGIPNSGHWQDKGAYALVIQNDLKFKSSYREYADDFTYEMRLASGYSALCTKQ